MKKISEDQGIVTKRSAGQALVDQLIINGVDTVYCVPGESYLEILDGLWRKRDIIHTVQCRHEAAAAHMAEATGKLTNRPGICMVTRGPGATHAAIGVHTAKQDSTPMILFIGQISQKLRDREAFQEVDYRAMFSGLAKFVAEIDDPDRIPEYVNRAFTVAMSGRPGPVVLSLPRNMLVMPCASPDPSPAKMVQAGVSVGQMNELHELLVKARAPVMIVGGGGWTQEACKNITHFVERTGLPVAAGFRRQDLINNESRVYIGHLGVSADAKLIETIRRSDLVLAIGTRLDEIVSQGYTLLNPNSQQQKLVRVHGETGELGCFYEPQIAICAGVEEFSRALINLPIKNEIWNPVSNPARQAYLESQIPETTTEDVDLGAIMVWLRERLPEDAIITSGAGNYAVWVHRFLSWRTYGTQLAPASGAMGYGVPAGIAAKLRFPKRMVVTFAGDGCFLMSGSEMATAAQQQTNIIVIVINNSMYGTIKVHQERDYPGHASATDLKNPDFAVYAKSFDCHGETVRQTSEFPAAFERAVAAQKPALIELVVSQDNIAPGTNWHSV